MMESDWPSRLSKVRPVIFESDRPDEPPGGHNAMSFGGRFTLVSPEGKPLFSDR